MDKHNGYLIVDFGKGLMLIDARKNRDKSYLYAVQCAIELNGTVRNATDSEVKNWDKDAA
jgi:hypothetical protein